MKHRELHKRPIVTGPCGKRGASAGLVRASSSVPPQPPSIRPRDRLLTTKPVNEAPASNHDVLKRVPEFRAAIVEGCCECRHGRAAAAATHNQRSDTLDHRRGRDGG